MNFVIPVVELVRECALVLMAKLLVGIAQMAGLNAQVVMVQAQNIALIVHKNKLNF